MLWLVVKRNGAIFLVAAIMLLIGAAYVGGQWLKGQTKSALPAVGADGKVMGGVDIEVIPAEGLPVTAPDAEGLYRRHTDNSLYICSTRKDFEVSGGKAVAVHEECSGPEFEVVVGHETLLFRDITGKPPHDSIPADLEVQQVVEAATIDELDANQHVWVWGERRGDRILARVIIFGRQ